MEGIKREVEKLTAKEQHIELTIARARKTLVYKAAGSFSTPESSPGSKALVPFALDSESVSIKKKEKSQKKRKFGSKKKLTTNTLFCIVIFHDFLKELAALSQQHSVLDPIIYTPSTPT